MRKLLPPALLAVAACNTLPPQVLPPPFGPATPQDTHLFFPTGLAATADGALLVANGNFNHAYDAGTVVGLRPEYVSRFFSTDTSNPDKPPLRGDNPLEGTESAVMIGNYAGPLTLDAAGATAFTGSRDTGLLNAVAVGAGGAVSCAPGAGANPDCRSGLVDLKNTLVQGSSSPASIDGPYSIIRGNFIPLGQTAPQAVLYVSSVVPHIDSIQNGLIATSSQVAALDMANPSHVLFTVPVANQVVANGWAPGPMVFDGVRRRLFLSGCYQRFGGTGAGEPGSGKCGLLTNNYLRVADVDAGSAATVQLYDLYKDVLSSETTQLLLADPDPATQAPTTLWATMRSPDALVQIELPLTYSVEPRVRRVVAMPVAPADLLRIPRAGASDLIAVVAEKTGEVAIYDVGLGQVVAVVERLGNSPFTLAQVPCPAGTNSACLAAAVFNDCRVAFIEVPLAQPSAAVLRGRAGGCL